MNKKSRFPSASRALALEPRMLFDGAGAAGAVDQLTDNPSQNSADSPQAPAAYGVPMLLNGLPGAPEIDSILRQTPSFDTTNAQSVIFRVTFSEQVSGVTANSFVIAPGSLSGATIQLVTPVDAQGRQYDVMVGNLSGSGTLNIDLAASSGIKSQATHLDLATTNPADASRDHSYSIDRLISAPSTTAINIGQVGPASIITSANSGFTLSGRADAGDTLRIYLGSVLVGSGTANPAGEWTVQVQPAAPLADGHYNLVVRSNDAAGNTQAEAYALQIDTGAPVLDTGASHISDIIVTLQFNEPLKNAGVPALTDFTVRVDSVLVTPVHIAISGNRVQLTLASPVLASQTIRVSYSGNVLRDAADARVAHFSDLLINNDTKASNQAPVIAGTAFAADKNTTWYSLGDPAVAVFGSRLANDSRTLLLTDADDSELETALVSISSNFKSGDKLGVWDPLSQSLRASGTLQSGIRYQFDAVTGQLIFTGHASREQYQTALQSVRFTAASDKDVKRTISLVVNDGQSTSALATRSIYVLGTAFSLDDTTTSYLVGKISGYGDSNGVDLVGVNLVMGTVDTVKLTNGSAYNDFTTSSVNALGFNSLDGHLYASLNAGTRGIIRFDAETKTYVLVSTYSLHTNAPQGDSDTNSADFDNNGVMWLFRSGTFYRLDLNPESANYGQWLKPINVSNYSGTDMSFSKDGRLFTADAGKLYEVTFSGLSGNSPTAVASQISTTGVAIPSPGIYGFPMQYFDTNGYFYFTSGGTTIYRVNVTDTTAADYRKVTTITAGATLPTTGDAGRIVTINLDFGDASDSRYKTALSADGARHNLLGSEVWLGNRPNAETDAKSDSSATPDTDDAVTEFPALRQGMSSYSVDVKVTNAGSRAATLIGWIDFNKDGKFSVNEAATVTVPANTVNGTVRLTWAVPVGLSTGDTYVRLRIASDWNAATDVSGHDQRSYGPRMDGEVEDYKITIQQPDSEPPTVTQVTVVGGDTGPRSTPVGLVQVVFSEPVVGVDISDFSLTRDGQLITLPANTPVSGSGTTWTIDLSAITSPTGRYVLSVPNGADILDDAGIQLTNGGGISFEIDTTAPVIDLDTANDSSRDWRAISLAGAAVSLDNNLGPAQVVEQDNGRSEITRIDITIYGIRDEGHERLLFGTRALDASGGFATQSNVLVGAVAVDISYNNGTFTLVRSGGGVLTQEQASAIVADLQYRNELNSDASNGERIFSITATDRAGVTSSPALATVEVTGGSGNSGVQIPTVNSLHTSDSTPTLNGQAAVPAGATLTVTVNGVTYTWQGGAAPTAPLQYDPDSHQWQLTIPPADALADGVYSVTATVVNGADSRSDITSNELVVDTLPPEPPTVVSQITHNLTPTISGSAEVRDGEYLQVQVNGVTYTEGDGHLLRVNNQWTLVIPPGHALTPNQTYDVTATTFDRAGNSRSDSSSGELIIDTIAPVLDLNPADASTLDDQVITYGGAVYLDVSASPVGLMEDSGRLSHISLTVSGLKDSGHEWLSLGSASFSAAGGNVSGVSVAGVAFSVEHAGNTFTIRRSDGAAMSISEAKAVISALRYHNDTDIVRPSSGERLFSFTVTDEAGLSSAAAVARVVIPGVPQVNSIVVNEASPYAVFTVTVSQGEMIQLSLANGLGGNAALGLGVDYGAATGAQLQYSLDGGSQWLDYDGTAIRIEASNGQFLVRTAINNDADYEGNEVFSLSVQAVDGLSATGIASIHDDGSGSIFTATGTLAPTTPGLAGYVVPDDDRRLSIDDISVNEASPHGVFVVQGIKEQSITLALADGTATSAEDYGTTVEYSLDNGQTWQLYAGVAFEITAANGQVLVRMPILNDTDYEGSETFTLTATVVGGQATVATATIYDEGSGTVFDGAGQAVSNPVLDDDRRLSIDDISVNEASPHGVFVVRGIKEQSITLALADGTATSAEDYGTTVEYSLDNGQTWQLYTGVAFEITAVNGQVLVRMPILNDTDYEGSETFTLTATVVGGQATVATATIYDEGSGTVFDGAGQAVSNPVLDDDRRLSIDDISVNEASEHGVFVVRGIKEQSISLALADGTATSAEDYGTTVEYSLDNGQTWQLYAGVAFEITAVNGQVLVRMPILNDTDYEGSETFTLTATVVGGQATVATATIYDEGSGTVFDGAGQPVSNPVLDDDRRLSIDDISVNEASEHGVFVVRGIKEQSITLALADGTATSAEDYGNTVEYSLDNGQTWQLYAGVAFEITAANGQVLVRMPILNDTDYEGSETFTLTATVVGGQATVATATIYDEGSGTVFDGAGQAVSNPVLDDDRRLSIDDISVNEASPHGVFVVRGIKEQSITLALADGTATSAEDYGTTVEYSLDNGQTWQLYTGVAFEITAANGQVLVRTPIHNDTVYEGSETFTLTATVVGGQATVATATIYDEGSGTVFDSSGQAVSNPVLDDDRRVTVSSPTVNEGSAHIVYSVTGRSGQAVALLIAGGTATGGGVDYVSSLQYSTDNGVSWHNYVAGVTVVTPAAGHFLVRLPLVNDSVLDGGETVLLQATPVGGHSSLGTATIVDDGSGSIFVANGSVAASVRGEPDYVQTDDDRRVMVSSPQVNEASPYVVYTVNGTPGQALAVAISGGTASPGADYRNGSEYSTDNGLSWHTYVAGTPVITPASAQVLIRIGLVNDGIPDNGETLELSVTPLGGHTSQGLATILDDGTGSIFGADGQPRFDLPRSDDHMPSVAPLLSSQSPDGRPVSVDVVGAATDPNGDPLQVTAINGQPVLPGQVMVIAQGSVRVEHDGRISFTPKPGIQGTVAIDYSLSDPSGRSATGTWQVQVQIAPQVQASEPTWGRNQGGGSYWTPAPAVGVRPAQALLLGEQADEPSVFFDGSVFDRVPRLQIPLHPALFINNEVAAVRAQREQNDARAQLPGNLLPAATGRAHMPGVGLGFVDGQYVQNEVFNLQQWAKRLASLAAGSAAPWLLQVDAPPGAELDSEPGTDAAPESAAERAPAVPGAALALSETVPAARSFTEQVRLGGQRLPVALR